MEELYNMKEREVYCPKCKVYSDSKLILPVCNTCSSKLITVVYDMLTGNRITGDDELAKGFNGAA